MEQWEHMVLEAVIELHRDRITAVAPDGRLIDVDSGDPSIGRLVQALNELGQQGWAMVSKETHRTEQRRTETFWLRRPAPPQGGWASSA
jgi:hypothetical protein